jgi:HAD superfamily hydrolase (TIGR01450 family)
LLPRDGKTLGVPWALDLDGVVWLAGAPIPGAAGAVARLRQRGEEVVFVTNNSNGTVADNEARLARCSIDAAGHVLTSAQAAATLVDRGERILICGGPGVREAVMQRGAEPVEEGNADAVIVGYHREFDYERLRAAATAIRQGARFLATNDDATYPTPDGPIPGNGALVAAVAVAAGAEPLVAGKPYAPMADLVRTRYGADGVVVGDRPDTDGRFARALGWRFALVLSGVTGPGDLPVDPAPAVVAADLATLVDGWLGDTA